MKLAIIVAMDENNLIGKDNNLPWRLSADLVYFKHVTMGKPIIMGRATYESIGRPLPGRKNIVISAQPGYHAEGCTVCSTIEQALESCADADEVMVMGGASLYKQLLADADTLYLTLVHAQLKGDTWFPLWDKSQWQQISKQEHPADDKNEYPHSFIVYKRITDGL